MGTWLYGWVETRHEIEEKYWWTPMLRTFDYFLTPAGWWRIPLFGNGRLFDGFFEPIPSEPGVPDDLSPTVRFDVANGGAQQDGFELVDLEDFFYNPEREAGCITLAQLQSVDWDEPRHDDVVDELLDLDEEPFSYTLYEVFDIHCFDSDGEPVEWTPSRSELSHDVVRDVVEHGSTTVEGYEVRLEARTRRDYLPPRWSDFIDFMSSLVETHPRISDDDVRWFYYFG